MADTNSKEKKVTEKAKKSMSKPANTPKAEQKKMQKQKKPKKIKVLFVCTGNTCRSPMAEQLFKEYLRKKKQLSAFDVKSAGLYADEGAKMNSYAEEALKEMGLKVMPHKSRQLDPVMAEGTDIIICMTVAHKAQIEGHAAVCAVGEITGANDVPDPYGGDLERYRAVAKYLQYACGDFYRIVLDAQAADSTLAKSKNSQSEKIKPQPLN